jgi:hypothetical protein
MKLPKELQKLVMYDSKEHEDKKIYGKLYVSDVEEWVDKRFYSIEKSLWSEIAYNIAIIVLSISLAVSILTR